MPNPKVLDLHVTPLGNLAPYSKFAPYSSETIRERFERLRALLLWCIGLIDGPGHIGLLWTDRAQTKTVPLLKASLHVSPVRAVNALARGLRSGRVTRSGSMVT